MQLKTEEYDDDLKNKNSEKFKRLRDSLRIRLNRYFLIVLVRFLYVYDFQFYRGSVICEFKTAVLSSSNETSETIVNKLVSGNDTGALNITIGKPEVTVVERVSTQNNQRLYIIIGVAVAALLIFLLLLVWVSTVIVLKLQTSGRLFFGEELQ